MENFKNEEIELSNVYVNGGDSKTTFSDCNGNTGEDIYHSKSNSIIYLEC